MSVTGKFTTIYDIIERIRRDGINDFTEEEAKEWIWEAISLGGVVNHFVHKTLALEVDNARVMLPYDLYDFTSGGIREYYSKAPLIKDTNIYRNPDTVGEIDNTLKFSSEAESIVFVDGEQLDGSTFLSAIPNYAYQKEELTYWIDNGFIFTGFKQGVIEISYKAFPIDNDYNPMIEDNMKVIRFVVAYIKKKVISRMFLRDEVNLQKKQMFDQEYSFAAASMKSDANIGNIEDLETLKSALLRLRRDPNMHRIGFRGFGYREGLNL
jgi:hypothetical protein